MANTLRTGKTLRTTIALRYTTKNRLAANKSPGQSYDGFIWQLVDLWERTRFQDRVADSSCPSHLE